jgi:ADP-heptose:LPS heptosyltransferase
MPYLPNLSSPEPPVYEKSIKAMIREVKRCDQIGIPFLVTHLGSHKGTGAEKGIKRLTSALIEVAEKTKNVTILLENTAGQKNSVGSNFSELSEIFSSLKPAERFGILCQKLIKEDGKRVVLLGTEKESELMNRIRNSDQSKTIKIIPPVNLRVLTGFLKKSRLLIGNDSGLMHLAAMVGVPVLGIFGPGSPETTGPYMAMEKQEVVTKNFSCSPCKQKFFKECKPSPLNKPYCIEDITVKDIHEAVRRLLKRY